MDALKPLAFLHQHDGDAAALIFHVAGVLIPVLLFAVALTYFAHEDHRSCR